MVSVIMSVYKEKLDWIRKSTESILNQTFTDFEYIIVIDNPNINGEVKLYLENLAQEDKRVILLYNECNMGLALSLNKGIAYSKGEYIARMDADDISVSTRFQKQVEHIKKTGADVVFTNRILIDENDVELRKCNPLLRNIESELLNSNVVVHPAVMMKSDVVKNNGGYRDFRRSQDYDLWLRLLSNGCKFSGLDEYLLYYRISSQNLSNSGKLEQYYANRYQKKLYLERLKNNGNDSFSVEHYNEYIRRKNITFDKNKKALKCFASLEKARECNNIIIAIIEGIKAFIIMPSVFCEVLNNYMQKVFRRKFSKIFAYNDGKN